MSPLHAVVATSAATTRHGAVRSFCEGAPPIVEWSLARGDLASAFERGPPICRAMCVSVVWVGGAAVAWVGGAAGVWVGGAAGVWLGGAPTPPPWCARFRAGRGRVGRRGRGRVGRRGRGRVDRR